MKNNWKKNRIFTAFLWSLLFLAGWNFSGVKAAAAAGPSCAKTKTVYFQKQAFPDPVSQKVITSYDLLGTGELDLKHLSGKMLQIQFSCTQKIIRGNDFLTYRIRKGLFLKINRFRLCAGRSGCCRCFYS